MDFREELEKVLFNDSNETVADYDLQIYKEEIFEENIDKLPILYRYSKADYDNIRNFETGTLYLSEIGDMNDIFEGLSCSIDDAILTNLSKLRDLAYIKSLTEKREDLKMWSMYADNFAGMCVAYDFRKAEESDWMWNLFPVCYSKKRKTNPKLQGAIYVLEKLKEDIQNQNALDSCEEIRDILALFLTKSCEWKNEKEWRIIVTYPQMNLYATNLKGEECSVFYKIGNRTIDVHGLATDVYLGPKMKERIKSHIREIADRLNIRVHEMVLHPTEYRLIEKE